MQPVKTFFMVDDDSDDQEVFAIALEEIGGDFHCHFANDGIDALKKLKADKAFIPDLIFLDLNMPRMNGKQCLVEIKKLDHLKKIPVIIYSTSSDAEFLHETRELGAAGYFTKPASVTELTKQLAQLLNSY